MEANYLHLTPGEAPLPALEIARPFRAILVAERKVENEWRWLVTEWLVRSGCLYFIAWGCECERWHDNVDDANLEAFDFGPVPDDAHVMTTWHEHEALEEALWFAAHSARHPTMELKATIVLHVSPDERRAEFLGALAKAGAAAEDQEPEGADTRPHEWEVAYSRPIRVSAVLALILLIAGQLNTWVFKLSVFGLTPKRISILLFIPVLLWAIVLLTRGRANSERGIR